MRKLLAAVSIWLGVSSGALALPYTSLYVFGDSLSDAGNAFVLSGGIWPPSPPYAQRFSNGPTAAEILAGHLGIPGPYASTLGGTNFAVGGATTGILNFNFEVQSPFPLPATLQFTGIQAQIGAFLGTPFNPATSLFIVWGGPNDVFLALATNPTPAGLNQAVTNAVQNLAFDVGALALAGAQHILVPNMPNLGATPFAASVNLVDELMGLSAGFNQGLAQAMALVEAQTGADIVLFDTFVALEQLIANAPQLGFTNTFAPCVFIPAALAAGCPGFLFFDGVHPTTATHSILAVQFLAAISEPSSAALAFVAFLALAAVVGRRRARGG